MQSELAASCITALILQARGSFGTSVQQQVMVPQGVGGVQGLQPMPGYQMPGMGMAPGMYGALQREATPRQYHRSTSSAPNLNGSLF